MNESRDQERAVLWLRHAAEDLAAARVLAASPGIAPRHACFLAQQAAERALKAVLSAEGTAVPRSHDLAQLRAAIKSRRSVGGTGSGILQDLSSWASVSQNPCDWPEATAADAAIAVSVAESIVREAEAAVSVGEEAAR